MEKKEIFTKIMEETPQIALASSRGDQSDVRLLVGIYKNARIYISTIKDSPKTVEFENPKVSLTTLLTETGVARVRKACIRESELSPVDLLEDFSKKSPGYEKTLEKMGDKLVIYEITFDQVEMTTKEGLLVLKGEELR